jgi:hypothetical protein
VVRAEAEDEVGRRVLGRRRRLDERDPRVEPAVGGVGASTLEQDRSVSIPVPVASGAAASTRSSSSLQPQPMSRTIEGSAPASAFAIASARRLDNGALKSRNS